MDTETSLAELREVKKLLILALKRTSKLEQSIFLSALLSEHEDCIIRADGLFNSIQYAIAGINTDIDRIEGGEVVFVDFRRLK